jgi:hypothetical protein
MCQHDGVLNFVKRGETLDRYYLHVTEPGTGKPIFTEKLKSTNIVDAARESASYRRQHPHGVFEILQSQAVIKPDGTPDYRVTT